MNEKEVRDNIIDEDQIVEVEYNKEMLDEDVKLDGEDLVQDEVNEDPINELLGEGTVIENEY